jgi:hypothetical protein
LKSLRSFEAAGALVHERAIRRPPSRPACQQIRAEAGMRSPVIRLSVIRLSVIRLSTLQPIFASIR